MLSTRIKKFLRFHASRQFGLLTVDLDSDLRFGITLVLKQTLARRSMFSIMVLAGIAAATFEVSSIGMLGIAASIATSDGPIPGLEYIEKIFSPESGVSEWLQQVSRGSLFITVLIGAVVLQILRSTLSYIARYCLIKINYSVLQQTRALATSHALSLSYEDINAHPPGYLNTIITECHAFGLANNSLSDVILAFIFLISYVVLMVLISLPMTGAALILLIALAFSMNRLVRLIKRLGEEMASGELTVGAIQVEALLAHRVLRVFDVTKHVAKFINLKRENLVTKYVKSKLLMALVIPTVDVFTTTGVALFLIIGYLVFAEQTVALIPSVLVFLVILFRLMPKANLLNQTRLSLGLIVPKIRKISAFLQTDSRSTSRNGGHAYEGLGNNISFNRVSFQYAGSESSVLKEISFSFEKNSTIALVGPSGVGKSTVVDLLTGLIQPTEGTISVDGVDLEALNTSHWLKKIGSVEQEVFLFDTSVRDNIVLFDNTVSTEKVIAAAKLTHAHEFIVLMPEGYQTRVGERGYRLSVGQRQRLALARALVRDPELLILDEATSSLDSDSEFFIQNTLNELHSECTVFIVAHRLSTVQRADQIIVMQDGRITEKGTHKELLELNKYYSHIWHLQAGGEVN